MRQLHHALGIGHDLIGIQPVSHSRRSILHVYYDSSDFSMK